jgi:hypothetical protein
MTVVTIDIKNRIKAKCKWFTSTIIAINELLMTPLGLINSCINRKAPRKPPTIKPHKAPLPLARFQKIASRKTAAMVD